MFNFSQLVIVKSVEPEKSLPQKERYVIGCDPFQSNETCNVFTVYDKYFMRVSMTVRTKKNFPEFVEWLLAGDDINRKMYKTSYKFIDEQGLPIKPEQIYAGSITPTN